MQEDCEPESIVDVLECVDQAGSTAERVHVSEIVDHIGDGAFAPLMLVPALVIISPASAIFGLPTVCAILIALISAQMAFGKQRLWLPDIIRRRSVSAQRLDTATSWLAKPAAFMDKLTRRRLSLLVDAPADRFWAGLCTVLALVIPFFELVPMSATIIASAIALFGLAVIARDGLLALVGLAVLASAAWLLANVLPG